MSISRCCALISTLLAVAGAGAQSADCTAQLAELQAELNLLRAQGGDNWITTERAEEIKGLVRDVLADADTRASLQGGGASAGYDGGFFISSSDGNWKFKVNGLEQVRFVYNNDTSTSPATTDWGFENRRTQLTFSGNVVDPSWTYIARFNYGADADPYTNAPGTFDLQDAAITKSMSGGWGITAGQFKTPFMRESLMEDGVQLTAERSVVDYYFSSGYQQGLRLDYSADHLRFSASWGNGFRAATNPANPMTAAAFLFQNDPWAFTAASFDVSARLDLKLSGEWKQFDKETSFRGEGNGLLVGGAVGYENARGSAAGAGTLSFWATSSSPLGSPVKWTIDATAMFGGGNLSVAFVGQNVSNFDGANVTEAQNYYGMVAQGGYMLSDELELFGRWEWMSFNNAPGPIPPSTTGVVQNILTIGANWYFAMNNCKWTLDVGIPLNDDSAQQSFFDTQGAGWAGGTGQRWNIRTQLQIGF